ncbi:MurR/RpiR family transcriptional regulator [Marivita hallyeonensis]|uniref:Transcriptional regulator, RpiR family n=1 Tax=Marivita hallyeonensis TaxID=996342 RepID=A0A1M5U280_9RHOB|nr:MurR/RpiR family transcriptional regulator [Marivita hallyeonensis]SHH57195.1 transcriptional regulator, RpiR family [Marivita hallyeonensis]
MAKPLSVKERLHDQAAALTPAERQLTGVLMRDYPVGGLQSITKIAEAAGVSTPTVIRLARKLGFDGFPELQSAMRAEASAQFKTPIGKRDIWDRPDDGPLAFKAFAEAVFDNLSRTIDRLEPSTFEAIAGLLSDRARGLFLSGGRITRSNADYFYNHLQIIRPDVTLLSTSPNVWPQYILDMNARSVLIVFDIRRYESDLERLAELSKERGAALVLFTDQWGSPISRVADHVVNAMIEVPSSWDSTLAINLVIEALIAEVQSRVSESAQGRIEALEEMFRATRIFRKS